MASLKASLLLALLRLDLWPDYLLGLLMATLETDFEYRYRYEVEILELALDPVLGFRTRDAPAVHAIQARIDRLNQIFEERRYTSWFFGWGLRMEIHIWIVEGNSLVNVSVYVVYLILLNIHTVDVGSMS
ncbi:hypothetical protein AURDEDRAFT_159472 [Auricularia subglabra TFB-10046 SS5]|nr:hypothetical protein AURDEDRAFT_159472 [Auricularia subglabra TFB-10046 SS5]